MTRKKLGKYLLDRGLISEEGLMQALAQQERTSRPLGEVIVELGFTTEEDLVAALAEQQDVPSWDLLLDPPSAEALSRVPSEMCLKESFVPVQVRDNTLVLAMRNPGNVDVIDKVAALTKMRVEAVQANDKHLTWALKDFVAAGPVEGEVSVEEFVSQAMVEFTAGSADEEERSAILTEADTRPVIGLVNQIFADAIERRASDIHMEPRSTSLEVRYRIDGRLVKIREIPLAIMPMVAARVKIMADLDVADHRLPQDGRITMKSKAKHVDLRISILPNHYGQRIVARVLDRASALKGLDELGLNEHNVEIFKDLIEKPYGMILVTGPTGSGKTTTLYAALNALKSEATNIMTCEDPIEYELGGINQSQVHEKIGLTFAAQLRSILRQDPDVILVGEIRDNETAATAMKAALTGHLLLSTLHCNSAPASLPRLLDMGIDSYMLSTSLIGVVAQRLLRVLCPHCKELEAPTDRDLAVMESFGCGDLKEVWHSKGCEQCNNGYSGRTSVHEIMPVTGDVGTLISAHAPVGEIIAAARLGGYRTLQEDALERVLRGQTTFEEARRLIFFDTLKAKTAAKAAEKKAA